MKFKMINPKGLKGRRLPWKTRRQCTGTIEKAEKEYMVIILG